MTPLYLNTLPGSWPGIHTHGYYQAYQVRPNEATTLETGQRIPYSHELISRADVERYLQNAPPPVPDPGPASVPQTLRLGPRSRGPNNMIRPKEFKNHGRVIPRTSHYTEYPTMDYPYDNQTAEKGAFEFRKTAKGGMVQERMGPGYVWTITDQNKHIEAVLYHPDTNKTHDAPLSSKTTGRGPKPKPKGHSGALYPAQEVFRAQTFGPRQTMGPPVSKG